MYFLKATATSYFKCIRAIALCLFVTITFITISPSSNVYAADLYGSMSELMDDTESGVDWQLSYHNNQSNTLIAAIHGGNIEAGTTELSSLTAALGNYNYYTFQGIRTLNNAELHVTSTNFDEPIVEDMQQAVSNSVMIHGASGSEAAVYIGGKDERLKASIENALQTKGFNVLESPSHLEGASNQNIANKNAKGAGVQLELTYALRQSFFNNKNLSMNSRSNEANWSINMYAFAEAIHQAIEEND